MNQALLQKKLKDSFGDTRFKPSEDSLTSSTIGVLQYLDGTTFWNLLRNSCGERHLLPKHVGDLIEVHFWRRFLPDLEYNLNHVEPDVYCEFEHYNLIIEAKKGDFFGQDEIQWRKEINSYYKEVESDKPLLFIAIGGNNSLRIKTIDFHNSDIKQIIYSASWQRLLATCYDLLHNGDLRQSEGRIINDVVHLFEKHHFYKISWLKDLHPVQLRPNSQSTIENWEGKDQSTNNSMNLLIDLFAVNLNSLNSLNNLSSWKIT